MTPPEQEDLAVVDFNRARIGRKPGVWRRTRDICRLPVLRREHREAFLGAYWGEVPPRWTFRSWFYVLAVNGYIFKHDVSGGRALQFDGGYSIYQWLTTDYGIDPELDRAYVTCWWMP